MKKVVSIFGMLFILATICTVALADPVPGALLYLDARDNPAHDKAWTNLGTVGGELSGAGKPPAYSKRAQSRYLLSVLIQSRSSIPTRSPVNAGATKVTTSNCFLMYWTIEFLFKINGDSHQEFT